MSSRLALTDEEDYELLSAPCKQCAKHGASGFTDEEVMYLWQEYSSYKKRCEMRAPAAREALFQAKDAITKAQRGGET